VEPELRTTAPAHATGAVVFVALDEIAPDPAFRLRPEGDVSVLAASIGRLGQLQPVELRPLPGAGDGGPRYQVVAGFRRLAALGLLQRDRVLSRVHEALGDDDAWALAIVQGLTGEPLGEAELLALRDRLAASGLTPWALDLVEEARARAPVPPEERERFLDWLEGAASPAAPAAPAPEEVVEVTAEDFGRELAMQMARVNQDLATAYGSWSELPDADRRLVIAQARYVAQLLPFLEEAEG
jgi:hypothetical protein